MNPTFVMVVIIFGCGADLPAEVLVLRPVGRQRRGVRRARRQRQRHAHVW